MCFVSKRVKQKTLTTSQKQLKDEYMGSEEKLKFYSFSGQKKLIKDELKILRLRYI